MINSNRRQLAGQQRRVSIPVARHFLFSRDTQVSEACAIALKSITSLHKEVIVHCRWTLFDASGVKLKSLMKLKVHQKNGL